MAIPAVHSLAIHRRYLYMRYRISGLPLLNKRLEPCGVDLSTGGIKLHIMTGPLDPEALIEGFNEKLRSKWKNHRRQSFNTSTKGSAYENTLQRFLMEYFSGTYDIRTNTVMVDDELEVFDIFNSGDAEFDVVANFRQYTPSVIFESGDMKWVPYEGVAFICEVKSSLTKSALEDDLEKYAKLYELGKAESFRSRFPQETAQTRLVHEGSSQRTSVSVPHQLRCLVYDEQSIAVDTLYDVLAEYTEIWDIVVIVEEGVIIVSPEHPFVEGWFKRIDVGELTDPLLDELPDILALPDGLIWFIILLTVSIPQPPQWGSGSALMKLVQREWKDEGGMYDTIALAWEQLA